MKITFAVALFLGIISTAESSDDTFTDSYEDCLKMAAGFDNTCDSQDTAVDFDQLATKPVTCNMNGAWCPSHGTNDDGTCTFTRKLCVTCRKDGDKVKVRTQTNGLPNHCMHSPRQVINEVFVDYESNWLPAASPYAGEKLDQEGLDALICNIMRSRSANLPEAAEWTSVGTNEMNTGWGVSTSGVMIFNGISGEGGDPFYPGRYGRVTNPASAVEAVDACLSHPQRQGEMHYHTASPCVPDDSINPNVPMEHKGAGLDDHLYALDQDILAWIRKGFEKMPYRSIFGLSKDGRPIYSPHYDNVKDYNDCEVDVCNGINIGGHYSYVATFFHPYIMGCYGPGDSPNLSQSCSLNPRQCKVARGTTGDTGAITLTASLAVAAMLFNEL